MWSTGFQKCVVVNCTLTLSHGQFFPHPCTEVDGRAQEGWVELPKAGVQSQEALSHNQALKLPKEQL